jgi:hypothetical protein
MNSNTDVISVDPFLTPGNRLSHLLDLIEFRKGRGRGTDLHEYLIKQSPDQFNTLAYTSVRSWLGTSAPPMSKCDVIIEALQKNYTVPGDIGQVKIWWKLGGAYPFGSGNHLMQKEIPAIDEEKLEFSVMAIVMDESKEYFNSLAAVDLIKLKEAGMSLAIDYANPKLTNCPEKYIRTVVKDALKSILDTQSEDNK